MMRDLLGVNEMSAPVLVAMLVFFALFVGMCLKIFVFGRRNPLYDRLAALPLDDSNSIEVGGPNNE